MAELGCLQISLSGMGKIDSEGQSRWRTALALIAQREELALASLQAETTGFVSSIAISILGNRADADEITADVYSAVWNKAADYDASRGTPLTWLLTMTRSRALDRLRSNLVARPFLISREIPNVKWRPDVGSFEREQSAIVTRLVAALSIEQKAIIQSAFFQGMTQGEMAESLQLPLGTVKTRIRLGLKNMRAMLSKAQA